MDKVLLIGEPMEMIAEGENCSRLPTVISGDGINVAVGLARLGLCPCFMAKLGKDPAADKVRKFMKENKLSDEFIITDPSHITGRISKNKAESGMQKFSFFRQKSVNSFFCKEDIDRLDLTEIRAVYFTGIFPAASEAAAKAALRLMELAHSQEITIVFDPNLRSQPQNPSAEKKALINQIAAGADVFLPSLKEAEVLCGLSDPKKIAEHYLALGTKKVVVKLGKLGAYYCSHVESGTAPTFQADEIVDTAGAGDGFSAGLISGICEEIPLGEAVYRANAVGSMQIQHTSDNEGLPTMEQLREYMLSHPFLNKYMD